MCVCVRVVWGVFIQVWTYVSRHALAICHFPPATGARGASANGPHKTDTFARAEQHASSSWVEQTCERPLHAQQRQSSNGNTYCKLTHRLGRCICKVVTQLQRHDECDKGTHTQNAYHATHVTHKRL